MLEVMRFLSSHPLTRNSKSQAFRRSVAWQLRSRIRSEIIVPWIGDTKLSVRRRMRGATGNIYAGLHEFIDMIFRLYFLQPDDLFLDIGANVGSYTILASGVCGAETWAFEPDPDSASFLRRNFKMHY